MGWLVRKLLQHMIKVCKLFIQLAIIQDLLLFLLYSWGKAVRLYLVVALLFIRVASGRIRNLPKCSCYLIILHVSRG